MEISQFTYFQQAGGIDLAPISAELTYGLERIAMFLSKVDSMFDVKWNETADVRTRCAGATKSRCRSTRFRSPTRSSRPWMLDRHEKEARRCLDAGLVLPAYEATLVCSHQFNLLDARGAVSATDRVGLIRRIRDLACACARAYVEGKEGQRSRLQPEPAAV